MDEWGEHYIVGYKHTSSKIEGVCHCGWVSEPTSFGTDVINDLFRAHVAHWIAEDWADAMMKKGLVDD